MSPVDPFTQIVDDLSGSGFSVTDDFVGQQHVTALVAEAEQRQRDGRMVSARTGKTNSVDPSLRGDSIAWIDGDESNDAIVRCLAIFEALREALSRRFFLNLHDFECHFASYPPGAVYQKHLDQFSSGDQRRQVSLVLYLNQAWRSTHGGALRLHLGDSTAEYLDIAPEAGRLVLFESSRFWHEVQPSSRERLSITGWFRTRAL